MYVCMYVCLCLDMLDKELISNFPSLLTEMNKRKLKICLLGLDNTWFC